MILGYSARAGFCFCVFRDAVDFLFDSDTCDHHFGE